MSDLYGDDWRRQQDEQRRQEEERRRQEEARKQKEREDYSISRGFGSHGCPPSW